MFNPLSNPTIQDFLKIHLHIPPLVPNPAINILDRQLCRQIHILQAMKPTFILKIQALEQTFRPKKFARNVKLKSRPKQSFVKDVETGSNDEKIMKFCPRCGYFVNREKASCPKCGYNSVKPSLSGISSPKTGIVVSLIANAMWA